ncbi:hypothetical protein R84B8_02471 [Treponema sp. R8-4-B8]
MSVIEKIVLPLFGIFGTLITILTFIFPQYANVQINLSVYVSTILILLLICSIFLKLLLDTKKHINDNVYFNNFSLSPIQFVSKENILILNRIINIPLNTTVSVYIKEGLYEKLLSIGYVSHVQEKIIQIKMLFLNSNLITLLSDNNNLNQVIVRPASNINNLMKMINKGEK